MRGGRIVKGKRGRRDGGAKPAEVLYFPLLCPRIYTSCYKKASAHVAAATIHRRVSKKREECARRKKSEKSENFVGDYDRSRGRSRRAIAHNDTIVRATNKIETFVAIIRMPPKGGPPSTSRLTFSPFLSHL